MSQPGSRGTTWAWRAFCLAVWVCATVPGIALATEPAPRLLVLRNDVVLTDLGPLVDRALLSALAEHTRFDQTYFSPTPFPEVQLAAGCQGRTHDCVERIATTLDADWLLVRELRRDDSGAVVLQLVAQDGATARTRRAEARVARNGSPERVVEQLVTDLYGSPGIESAPAAPPVARVDSDSGDGPRKAARVTGFTLLAGSAALLTSGIALGTVARKDHDRYARTEVTDVRSAENAQEFLDDAQRRSRVANSLFASGGIAAATGAAILIWRRVKLRDADAPRVSVDVVGTPELAALQVSGSFGGMQ
jgi:hypothetical protein